jgi:hypothetical protein
VCCLYLVAYRVNNGCHDAAKLSVTCYVTTSLIIVVKSVTVGWRALLRRLHVLCMCDRQVADLARGFWMNIMVVRVSPASSLHLGESLAVRLIRRNRAGGLRLQV